MNKKQDLTFAVHTRQQIHFLSVDFVVDFQITKNKDTQKRQTVSGHCPHVAHVAEEVDVPPPLFPEENLSVSDV